MALQEYNRGRVFCNCSENGNWGLPLAYKSTVISLVNMWLSQISCISVFWQCLSESALIHPAIFWSTFSTQRVPYDFSFSHLFFQSFFMLLANFLHYHFFKSFLENCILNSMLQIDDVRQNYFYINASFTLRGSSLFIIINLMWT